MIALRHSISSFLLLNSISLRFTIRACSSHGEVSFSTDRIRQLFCEVMMPSEAFWNTSRGLRRKVLERKRLLTNSIVLHIGLCVIPSTRKVKVETSLDRSLTHFWVPCYPLLLQHCVYWCVVICLCPNHLYLCSNHTRTFRMFGLRWVLCVCVSILVEKEDFWSNALKRKENFLFPVLLGTLFARQYYAVHLNTV